MYGISSVCWTERLRPEVAITKVIKEAAYIVVRKQHMLLYDSFLYAA